MGWRGLLAAAAVAALLLSGCTTTIAGVARPDLRGPGVELTPDGAGIILGFTDAAVQLELFTEPQCHRCAYLQSEYGDEIKSHLDSGRLALTYRPMMFLDDVTGSGYSATVTNALFLAVDPAVSAGGYQGFVQQLWAHQDLSQLRFSDGDFAAIATRSGLPAPVVQSIGQGTDAVDTAAVADVNAALLEEVYGEVATPVVYDPASRETLDIDDPRWLADLMRSA